MARRCPAAAYLSTMSSADHSSTMNTDDLDPTGSLDQRKAFLREMVDFMYRCHEYLKKCKEGKPMKEYKMCDTEKKENLQHILDLIKLKERENKREISPAAASGQAKAKLRFEPGGKSSPVSMYDGQTQMSVSAVSPISNLMGNREFATPPRVFKSTQGSSGFSTSGSPLLYGVSSSSASTDTGTPDAAVRGRICGLPGRQDLTASYPGYTSYDCPYKQRSANLTSPYAASRSQSPIRPQYAAAAAASAASAYQRAYAPSPVPQNNTAQTSFYEFARGGAVAPQYYEDQANVAFIEDDGAYMTEYDEEDVEYTPYTSASGTVICACR